MKIYKFLVKPFLSDDEYVEYFEFMKGHLIKLYGKDAVNQENFDSWKANRKNCKHPKFYIKMFCDDKICGYADLLITNTNQLYFCDVIIEEKYRRSLLLFEFLKFVVNRAEFNDFDEVFFHINHRNQTSLSTFKHLGYELEEEFERSNKFKISRENILKYIDNLKRR